MKTSVLLYAKVYLIIYVTEVYSGSNAHYVILFVHFTKEITPIIPGKLDQSYNCHYR